MSYCLTPPCPACPPQHNMPAGYILKATVEIQNTGTQSHAFDVIVAFGKGTNPLDFQVKKGGGVQDFSISPGDTKAVDVEIRTGSEDVGKWDVIVIVCDFHIEGGQTVIDYAYDWLICTDALVIS